MSQSIQNVEIVPNGIILKAPELFLELVHCNALLLALAFEVSEPYMSPEKKREVIQTINERLENGRNLFKSIEG